MKFEINLIKDYLNIYFIQYIIFNNNEEINNNNILFSKGNTNYLITKYQNEIMIYEIKQIKNEKKKIDK